MSLLGHWPFRSSTGTLPDDAHQPFLRAALLFALLAGFTLAVTLPVQAAVGRMNLSWVAHAQIHGHIQVVGFAGLFVVGVAYKLAPRFGSGRLALPALVPLTWWCLVPAVVLRAIGQPVADLAPFGALLAAAAALEVAGAVMFTAIIVATLRPALTAGAPHALLMATGAGWFAVQALLGAWWLAALALEGDTVLASGRNTALLHLQLYGFLLAVFLGVGMRAFPTFFGMPPPSAYLGRFAAVVLNAGIALVAFAALAREAGAGTRSLEHLAMALAGVAVLAAVSAFGWWRRETRLAVASQPLSWALRGALLWLTVTGAMLLTVAANGLIAGDRASLATADAIRHIFALGVITLGIAGMAQLILPEFATERMTRPTAWWRGAGLALVLSVAVLLRGVAPLLGLPSAWHFTAMAAGGLLALGAVAAFALLFRRASRIHAAHQARIAARRAGTLPVVD